MARSIGTTNSTTAVTGLSAATVAKVRWGMKVTGPGITGTVTVASTGVKGLTGNSWALAECWRR